jgi:hypothetical protein
LSNFRNYKDRDSIYGELFSIYEAGTDEIYETSTVDWATCHDATSGHTRGVAASYKVGEEFTVGDGNYEIRRTFLAFDLSNLGSSEGADTCVGATLRMGIRTSTGSPFVRIIKSTANDTISDVDFDAWTQNDDLIGVGNIEIKSNPACEECPTYLLAVADETELSAFTDAFGGMIKMVILETYDHADNPVGGGEVDQEFNFDFFKSGEIGGNCVGAPTLYLEFS